MNQQASASAETGQQMVGGNQPGGGMQTQTKSRWAKRQLAGPSTERHIETQAPAPVQSHPEAFSGISAVYEEMPSLVNGEKMPQAPEQEQHVKHEEQMQPVQEEQREGQIVLEPQNPSELLDDFFEQPPPRPRRKSNVQDRALKKNDYRVPVPRKEVHRMLGDNPILPKEVRLVITGCGVDPPGSEMEEVVSVKHNGPLDYVMLVHPPLIGIIKEDNRKEWFCPNPELGAALDALPVLVLMLKPPAVTVDLVWTGVGGNRKNKRSNRPQPVQEQGGVGLTDLGGGQVQSQDLTVAAAGPSGPLRPPSSRLRKQYNRHSGEDVMVEEMDEDMKEEEGEEDQEAKEERKAASKRPAAGFLPPLASETTRQRLRDTRGAGAAEPSFVRLPVTSKGLNRFTKVPVIPDELTSAARREAEETQGEGENVLECPWSGLYMQDGKIWTGEVQRGLPTGRVRLFADKLLTDQVTKSCHFCQNQHIKQECRYGAEKQVCVKSYCRTCSARYFPDLKYAEICRKCPYCRGICNCKPCLRHESHPSPPEYSFDQKSVLARMALSLIREPLEEILLSEEAESKVAGYSSLEEVSHSAIDGERILCNVCATSIPNLHFTCSQLGCGWDICVQCARKDRMSREEAVAGAMEQGDLYSASSLIGAAGGAHQLCQNSSFHVDSTPPLSARRFLDNDSLCILRKIISEFKIDSAGASSLLSSLSGSKSLSEWSQLISASLKPSIASSSISACEAPPALSASETASLVSKHCRLRRDESDPQVREDGCVQLWGHWIKLQDVRRAIWIQPGDRSLISKSREDEFVFSPHVSSLDYQHKDFPQYLEIFLERWRARQPVIVRGVKSRMPWSPEVMLRAAREMGNKKFEAEKELSVQVLDCRGFVTSDMTQHAFFQHYMTNCDLDLDGNPRMLKVKDWPPDEHFRKRLVRHNQDFLEMLPLPFYTHPHVAPLNLATMMPPLSNPTDLGPKTYIASGQIEEHEGVEWDSVTKLHQDMSDAVNILLHCQMKPDELVAAAAAPPRFGLEPAMRKSSYHQAGAVWDIWGVDDVSVLRGYINDHASEFKHQGVVLEVDKIGDVVFDHCFVLGSSHMDRMMSPSIGEGEGERKGGIAPWHFEQYEHEAVMIPAGCPHQVRNLRACIKVAVDFVSPEALGQTFKMTDMLSECHINQTVTSSHPPQPPSLPSLLEPPSVLPPAVNVVGAADMMMTGGVSEVANNAEVATSADVAANQTVEGSVQQVAASAAEGSVQQVAASAAEGSVQQVAASAAAVPNVSSAPEDSIYQDKLQGRLIMISAAVQLYKELHGLMKQDTRKKAGSKKVEHTTRPREVLVSLPLSPPAIDEAALKPSGQKRGKGAAAAPAAGPPEAQEKEKEKGPVKKKAKVEPAATIEEPGPVADREMAVEGGGSKGKRSKGTKSTPKQAT